MLEMDPELELGLRKHNRTVLYDYAMEHLAMNYITFTTEAALEALSDCLDPVEIVDPTSLSLPQDPLQTLFKLPGFQGLEPNPERLVVARDTANYLKKVLDSTPSGGPKPRSERVWLEEDPYVQYSKLTRPMSPILSARARRETPRPGFTAAIRAREAPMKLDELREKLDLKLVANEALSSPDSLKMDDVLGLRLVLDSDTKAAMSELLEEIPAFSRNSMNADSSVILTPRPVRAYMQRIETPPVVFTVPASPPIFSRTKRPRYAAKSAVVPSLATIHDLGDCLQAAPVEDETDDAMHHEHMVVVNGWHAFAPQSSPSPIGTPSLGSGTSDIDELLASPLGLPRPATLLEEKIDTPVIPRVRRVRGNESRRAPPPAASESSISKLLCEINAPIDTTCSTGPKHSSSSTPPVRVEQSLPTAKAQNEDCKSADPASLFDAAILAGATEDKKATALEQDDWDESDKLELGQVLDRLASPVEGLEPDVIIAEERLRRPFEAMTVPDLAHPNKHARAMVATTPRELVAPKKGDVKAEVASGLPWVGYLKAVKVRALEMELSWRPYPPVKDLPSDEQLGGAADIEDLLVHILVEDKLKRQPHLDADTEMEKERQKLLDVISSTSELESCGPDDDAALRWWALDWYPLCLGSGVQATGLDDFTLSREERLRLSKLSGSVVDLGWEDECDDDDGTEHDHADTDEPLKRSKPFRDGRRAGVDVEEGAGNAPVQLRGAYMRPPPLWEQEREHGDYAIEATNGSFLSPLGDLGDGDRDKCFAVEDADDELLDDMHVEEALSDFRSPLAESAESFSDDGPLSPFLPLSFPQTQRPDGDLCEDDRQEAVLPSPFASLTSDPTQPFMQGFPSLTVAPEPDLREGELALSPTATLAADQLHTDLPDRRPELEISDELRYDGPEPLSFLCTFSAFAAGTGRKIIDFEPTPPGQEFAADDTESNPLAPADDQRSSFAQVPEELVDGNTFRLPLSSPLSRTTHRYLSSLDVLQKSALVRSLRSHANTELVARESLGGADLIADPQSAVVFVSLPALPSDCKSVVDNLAQLSWCLDRILVLFLAIQPARSYKSKDDSLAEMAPNIYSPPVVKAVKKLRRDLNIAEACGTKRPAGEVAYAFANDLDEAAWLVRVFGERVQELDVTRGAIWGDRVWLTDEEHEDEESLASTPGMNRFAAAVVLTQTSLDDFLYTMSPEERVANFGPLVGVERIHTFNDFLEQQALLLDLPESSPPLPLTDSPPLAKSSNGT